MEPPGLTSIANVGSGNPEGEDQMEYTDMPMGEDQEPYNEENEVDENGEYSQFAFPSFSPTSRKRVRLRKPNFSDDCLELLIQLVNEHRDILYTKQAYTSEIHEKKIMVWTHITSQINTISSIPRTMEEVRKKWNDYSYYVKKKRENEKRGVHYTAHTNGGGGGSSSGGGATPSGGGGGAATEDYEDEAGTKTPGRDHRRVRTREDRVLSIVDGAHKDLAMGVGPDGTVNNDNISSLLLDACQRAREEANYTGREPDDNDDDDDNVDNGANSPEYQQFPKLKNHRKHDPNKVPPLPNPIQKYSYSGRGRPPKHAASPIMHGSAIDVRRSNRVRTPVKDVYTPPTKGRGRGRGRPPGSASAAAQARAHHNDGTSPYHQVHSQSQGMVGDEDLVQVNKQRLAIERRRWNVEKRRLKIEKRRLEIEEQRFKWQQMERKGIYPDSPVPGEEEEEEEEEEGEEDGDTQDESHNTGGEEDVQEIAQLTALPNGIADNNQLPPTSSPMKHENHTPVTIQPQPSSPVHMETPALTPGDVSFV